MFPGGSSAPIATPMVPASPISVAPSAQQVGPPDVWQPGPPAGPVGPQVGSDSKCGCVDGTNPFLGFIGDSEEKDTLYTIG